MRKVTLPHWGKPVETSDDGACERGGQEVQAVRVIARRMKPGETRTQGHPKADDFIGSVTEYFRRYGFRFSHGFPLVSVATGVVAGPGLAPAAITRLAAAIS